MRDNPQSPMTTSKPNPEKIIRKGNSLEGASSYKLSHIFGDLPDSVFHTPVVVSIFCHIPITGNYLKSELEDFPVEYTSFSPHLKEENLKKKSFSCIP
jgi:hypothetical protein